MERPITRFISSARRAPPRWKSALANWVFDIYGGDIEHLGRLGRVVFMLTGDYRFYRWYPKVAFMPVLGRYEYSPFFKLPDGTLGTFKTFIPLQFPEFSVLDFLTVQPLSSPKLDPQQTT